MHLLMDRHNERVKHQEWLTGVLASVVANFSMAAPKEPFSPGDFLPSLRSEEKPKRKRLNRQKIAQEVRNVMNAQMAVFSGKKP